jgi:rubrerythrin
VRRPGVGWFDAAGGRLSPSEERVVTRERQRDAQAQLDARGRAQRGHDAIRQQRQRASSAPPRSTVAACSVCMTSPSASVGRIFTCGHNPFCSTTCLAGFRRHTPPPQTCPICREPAIPSLSVTCSFCLNVPAEPGHSLFACHHSPFCSTHCERTFRDIAPSPQTCPLCQAPLYTAAQAPQQRRTTHRQPADIVADAAELMRQHNARSAVVPGSYV